MSDLAVCLDAAAPAAPAGIVLARYSDRGIETVARGLVADDAVFELGSITKAATGLLLAVAVTRGEVTLQTPLQECLPAARPRSPITLGALATHTAGRPRLALALLCRRSLLTLADPYASTTVEELLAHLARVRVRREPRMRYSNFGAALLGQALAARAGVPYEQLVHERVLGPLGITDVWARDAPPVSQPHDRRGRPVRPWTMSAYAPAGCLRGTTRGALALAIACLQPPVEMADAVTLALTPRTRHGQMERGLGWIRSPISPQRSIWWHNGGTHGSARSGDKGGKPDYAPGSATIAS